MELFVFVPSITFFDQLSGCKVGVSVTVFNQITPEQSVDVGAGINSSKISLVAL
jgi:hypothetical protein